MTITTVRDKRQIEAVVNFMYEKNQLIQHHIGYCGNGKSEILEAVQCLIREGNEFWVASYGGEIKGVIGYEKYHDTVELWGPFIEEDYSESLLEQLWETFKQSHETQNCKINIFCNQENTRIRQFAMVKGFEEKGNHSIMIRELEQMEWNGEDKTHPIEPVDYTEFIVLHNKIFPTAVYTGEEIVQMIDEEHEILVVRENDKLVGYSFLFCDKAFKEGNIEFVAVAKEYRGKGYGKALIDGSLGYFYKQGINQLQLCVDNKNQAALNLYQEMGFEIIHEMINYTQKVNLKQ